MYTVRNVELIELRERQESLTYIDIFSMIRENTMAVFQKRENSTVLFSS
jgi:hypothetical protein